MQRKIIISLRSPAHRLPQSDIRSHRPECAVVPSSPASRRAAQHGLGWSDRDVSDEAPFAARWSGMLVPGSAESAEPVTATRNDDLRCILRSLPRSTWHFRKESRLVPRFEVPTPPAANSVRNFKRKRH